MRRVNAKADEAASEQLDAVIKETKREEWNETVRQANKRNIAAIRSAAEVAGSIMIGLEQGGEKNILELRIYLTS